MERFKMNLYNTLRKIKILLIDDDEWIRDSLCLLFENEGCNLSAVESAEEALEVLKLKSFDIIITDYRLPGMDGLEFLSQIQTSCPNIIKILITAYGTDDIYSRAKDVGVEDIIKKPFTVETIEKSLSKLVIKLEQAQTNNNEPYNCSTNNHKVQNKPCICPNCGLQTNHNYGFPCFVIVCPKCGSTMTLEQKK